MKPVPRPPLVVYSGPFEAHQGLDILIEAFARVHERRPDASLLLVGGTPAQVAQYRAVADACGLNGGCRFTGRVPQATARCLSQRATVLTSPRVNGTTPPLEIYEQLASGIPLVATRIHSHTQVLDDGACFLVEPTVSGIADGILEAITDSDKRDAVTRGALELYERRYGRLVYEERMRRPPELRAEGLPVPADRQTGERMDEVIDAINGYIFTFIALCLLSPIMLIRSIRLLWTRLLRRGAPQAEAGYRSFTGD